MNNRSAFLLKDPHPCGHIVYPYTDEAHVSAAVVLFAGAGLTSDEGVVLIMAADHCVPIKVRLEAEGFNIDALEATGQLTCMEAEKLMQEFMVGGMPDEELFKEAVVPIIEKAVHFRSDRTPARVRVFGEMVSLLWGENTEAAERLEQLWNDVIEIHSVALLCTYALSGRRTSLPAELIACHSHHVTGPVAAETAESSTAA